MTGLSEEQRQSLLTDTMEFAYANMHADWAQAQMFAAVEGIATQAVAAERAAIREALGGEVAVEAAAAASAIFEDYDGCFVEPDMLGDDYDEDRKWWRDRARAALRAALDSLGAAGDGGGEG